MKTNSSEYAYLTDTTIQGDNSCISIGNASQSVSQNNTPFYLQHTQETTKSKQLQIDSTIERVAQWFLSLAPMSNKKLQKLCYYAYCWFIVFFNDKEVISYLNRNEIQTLCPEKFQAWIHGPVLPRLYHKYKEYGWHEIPQIANKPIVEAGLESLLQQVWDAYGDFSADELEILSHQEYPWQNARKGISNGDACSNEISDYDILQYYSALS